MRRCSKHLSRVGFGLRISGCSGVYADENPANCFEAVHDHQEGVQVPVHLVLLDEGLGVRIDGENGLVLLIAHSVVRAACSGEVTMLGGFSQGDSGVTLAFVASYHILARIFSAPSSSFSGKALRCPWMVTLLYCSMRSLYTPGRSTSGTLSSESLGEAVDGKDGAAVGVGTGGPVCFEMDLRAATRQAFNATRKSPSMGPIFWAPNLIRLDLDKGCL